MLQHEAVRWGSGPCESHDLKCLPWLWGKDGCQVIELPGSIWLAWKGQNDEVPTEGGWGRQGCMTLPFQHFVASLEESMTWGWGLGFLWHA